MIQRRMFFALAALSTLMACSQQVSTGPKGEQLATATRINKPAQLNGAAVAEVCYDGVVYLLTPQGGISPKVDKDSANQLSGTIGSRHPFIRCTP